MDTRSELFDLPPDIVYLNTAGAGPRLRSVNEAAVHALRTSAAPWRARPNEWIEQTENLRALAASVLHTQADALAFCPSVSYGMAVAVRNLPPKRGQNVVVLAREYPSNRAAWQLQTQAVGAELRSADPRDIEDWTAAVLRCVDSDTAAICVPHCHWADGSILDLGRIAQAAKSVRASLVVDASQSLGALPLDIAGIDPDFVICPGHKWLLGAYGLGWLWAAERWRETGEPIEQTVLAREALGDFTALGARLPPYRAGARRFDFGPYPHPISVPMATAALTQIQSWGVASIRARLCELTCYLEQALARHGLGEGLNRNHAPHLCAWTPSAESLPAVVKAIERAGIVLSVRNGGLRIAPHLHVREEQLNYLVDVLAAAV
ncbi:MAG: aminotransferase class V-fold PLP-dependent enzyme [Panacagrimonas sp.]